MQMSQNIRHDRPIVATRRMHHSVDDSDKDDESDRPNEEEDRSVTEPEETDDEADLRQLNGKALQSALTSEVIVPFHDVLI